ncbi:CAP Gly-rich domain-containing protein [Dichotomocladium elegans]|nr:CAP Gly-rich domain-containing protein [Dichotomocladium elegans]
MTAIQVGDRIQIAENLATVRFVGLVEGTKGEWLGIEWDDPKRGKHDGTHQGTRYFTSTRQATSSPFLAHALATLAPWEC